MKHYSRILFVDADDTARAPMAKAILQSKELDVYCYTLDQAEKIGLGTRQYELKRIK